MEICNFDEIQCVVERKCFEIAPLLSAGTL
jgi:hypothetical protein